MDKKKALLVVAGGRVMPDVISLLCVQPHLIIPVTSAQGWESQKSFVALAETLPNHMYVEYEPQVDAYNLDSAKRACRDAIDKARQKYPEYEWEWTFSISSGPKITGIAAYELAKEFCVPCLYVNTPEKKIVSLIKDIGVTAHDIFDMNVDGYMKIYQRIPVQHTANEQIYRDTAERWSHIARILALSVDTSNFLKEMREGGEGEFVILSSSLSHSTLIRDLESFGAIEISVSSDGTLSCAFTSKNFAKFITGRDWLEVYVWDQTRQLKFASDCQWGYEFKSSARNELDVALTYQAQLVFAECKTEAEPFRNKTSHLDTISAKAEMLGKAYVTKIFITNESKNRKGFANFKRQAHLRQIVVATYEDLPTIGQFLKRETETPTYSRI